MHTTVKSPAEIKEALQDKVNALEFGASLYFEQPDQVINFSKLLPKDGGNALSIKGAGGCFAGGEIARLFDGSEALFSCEHDRDWEFRFDGLCFNMYSKVGPALDLQYAQQSIIRDVRIQASEGVPLRANINGSIIEFLQLCWNRSDAIFEDVADVEVRNLFTMSDWGHYAGGASFRGITPKQPNVDFPRGLWIDNPHNEGCPLTIADFLHAPRGKVVSYRGGYHLAAPIKFVNTKKEDVAFDEAGMTLTGSSEFYFDGQQYDPFAKRSLWQRLIGK